MRHHSRLGKEPTWFLRLLSSQALLLCTLCLLSVRVDAQFFRRGDANGDGNVDLSDPISVLSYLFTGQSEPSCSDAGDTNDDGAIDISDSVGLLNFLFRGSNGPAAPFVECGTDPTPDGLSCDSFEPCDQDSEDEEGSDPIGQQLADRLALFIGTDIQSEDVRLLPVRELGVVHEAPVFVQRALRSRNSKFLLVAAPRTEGFEQAIYAVPPANREAYLDARFVLVLSQRVVADGFQPRPPLRPIPRSPLDTYAARRCIDGNCVLKIFRYPTTHRCNTSADCPPPETDDGGGGDRPSPDSIGGQENLMVLEYTKCDDGIIVAVALTVESDLAIDGQRIVNAPVSCNITNDRPWRSPTTSIFEDLGLGAH